MSIIVPAWGKTPNNIMLVGEGPGANEAYNKPYPRPFVGKAGQEQRWYLSPYHLDPDRFYLSNVVKTYLPGNPNPTPELIKHWTPHLIKEVHRCNPKVILAAGGFAARWFLGDDASINACHGMPYKPGHFDKNRADRCPPHTIIVPIHHPAAGLHEPALKPTIAYDYKCFHDILGKVNRRERISFVEDEYEGTEIYEDVTGKQLEDILRWEDPEALRYLALDTEGYPDDQYSIQFCWREGISYVLRCSQPDFARGIAAISRLVPTSTFILYDAATPGGTCYDMTMCRIMGLELSRAKIFNTMYWAYLLRVIAKGLKPLCMRFCGMRMFPFESLVAGVAKDKQMDYLSKVVKLNLPKPQTRIVRDNDNTYRYYTPSPIATVTNGIIRDVLSGKKNSKGKPTDPYERWKDVDREQRKMVEERLGKIPRATLADLPLADSTIYAAKDSDGTRRLLKPALKTLKELDLTNLMVKGMRTLPFIWEMQQWGMPASRKRFEVLREELDNKYVDLVGDLSRKYFFGNPINPNSGPQVTKLMEFRGIKPEKRTKPSKRFPQGQVSTSKKSIEHYRYTDKAIALVFEAREIAHIRDSFCDTALEIIPDNCDIWTIRANLSPFTEARRLSAEDPNLLAIPVRTEIGRRVRACYVCLPGETWVGVDLSQVEMRVLAHLSKSPFLIQKFLAGTDVHTETAMLVFGIDDPTTLPPEVWDFDYRLPAKTTNFGIVYGQQDTGLHDQLRMKGLTKWTFDECVKLRREVLRVLQIDSFIQDVIRSVKEKGYVRTMEGMYRYLPNIRSYKPSEVAEAGRHAVSHKVSGMAQDIIQNSMGWIAKDVHRYRDRGHDIKCRLQVHDELLFTVPKGLEVEWSEKVIHRMTNPKYCGVKMRVPIIAKGHTGRDWAELK